MARQFNAGNDNYLATVGLPAGLSDFPVTFSCWFNPADIDQRRAVFGLYDEGVSGIRIGIEIRGDVAGDPVRARYEPTTINADTTTGYVADKWQHACATYSIDDALDVTGAAYLDGGGKGTAVNSPTWTTFDTVVFGADRDNSPGSYMQGGLAEGAIWNIALSDAEVAMLATGIDARYVRPEALVYYCKVIGRDKPEPELIGGLTTDVLTASTDPPFIAPPRIYMPVAPQLISPVAAAPVSRAGLGPFTRLGLYGGPRPPYKQLAAGEGVGLSTGVATVTGDGASLAEVDGASAGVATVIGVPTVVGNAAGVAAVTGVPAVVGDAAGTATVVGVPTVVGAAAGTSTVLGVDSGIRTGVGDNIDGVGAVVGDGAAKQAVDADVINVSSVSGLAKPSNLTLQHPVIVDDSGAIDSTITGTTLQVPLTVSSGTNRKLIVFVAINEVGTGSNTIVSTADWNMSEGLTREISNQQNTGNNRSRTEIWYLDNPTAIASEVLLILSQSITGRGEVVAKAIMVENAQQGVFIEEGSNGSSASSNVGFNLTATPQNPVNAIMFAIAMAITDSATNPLCSIFPRSSAQGEVWLPENADSGRHYVSQPAANNQEADIAIGFKHCEGDAGGGGQTSLRFEPTWEGGVRRTYERRSSIMVTLASPFEIVGAAAGTSDVLAVGSAPSVGDAAGSSTVLGDGASTHEADGASDGVGAVSGDLAALFEADGASNGVATVVAVPAVVGFAAGLGAVDAVAAAGEGDGLAEGSATVLGDGTAVWAVEGSSDGVGAVAGDLTALFEADGASDGVGAVTGDLEALFEADGDVAGVATVIGTSGVVGLAEGTSTVLGDGASLAEADGDSAGIAAVTGDGASTYEAEGNVAGVAAVVGVPSVVGNAAGVATVTGDGASTYEADGDVAGIAVVTGDGASTHEADGDVAGSSTVTGVPSGAAIGNSDGVATVTGDGASTVAAEGNVAGIGTVTGIGGNAKAVGDVAGIATVTGDGASTYEAEGASTGAAVVTGISLPADSGIGLAVGLAAVAGIGVSTHEASSPISGTAIVLGAGFRRISEFSPEPPITGDWTPETPETNSWTPENPL